MFSPQDSTASEVIHCHYVHLFLPFFLSFPSHPLPLPSPLLSLRAYVPFRLCFSVACIIYHPGVASERAEISDWWLRQKQPLQYVSHMTWFLSFIWQQSTGLFLSKLNIPAKNNATLSLKYLRKERFEKIQLQLSVMEPWGGVSQRLPNGLGRTGQESGGWGLTGAPIFITSSDACSEYTTLHPHGLQFSSPLFLVLRSRRHLETAHKTSGP